jgi:F420-dependent oxidoreductase-like protein
LSASSAAHSTLSQRGVRHGDELNHTEQAAPTARGPLAERLRDGVRRAALSTDSYPEWHDLGAAMKVSINLTNFSWPARSPGIGVELARVADAADEAGIDTLWVGDHLIEADPNQRLDAEMLEAYTTLGFLAALTERVQLGTMVTAVTFRPPALLIKAVTTLDVVSGGRAWLGIGAGCHPIEARLMGLPIPPTAERFERLEETLQLARRMWSGDERPFVGVHYRLTRPVNNPSPLRRPHPPILIGGMGERRTLNLVARYADGCNLFDIPDGGRTVRRKLEVLAEHCAALGRPDDEIEKTLSTRLGERETAVEFADRCARWSEFGIDHLVVIKAGPWTAADVARLAKAAKLPGVSASRQSPD